MSRRTLDLIHNDVAKAFDQSVRRRPLDFELESGDPEGDLDAALEDMLVGLRADVLDALLVDGAVHLDDFERETKAVHRVNVRSWMPLDVAEPAPLPADPAVLAFLAGLLIPPNRHAAGAVARTLEDLGTPLTDELARRIRQATHDQDDAVDSLRYGLEPLMETGFPMARTAWPRGKVALGPPVTVNGEPWPPETRPDPVPFVAPPPSERDRLERLAETSTLYADGTSLDAVVRLVDWDGCYLVSNLQVIVYVHHETGDCMIRYGDANGLIGWFTEVT